MLAQSLALVVRAKQPALLQQRITSALKTSNCAGRSGGMMLKPSRGSLGEPILDQIGDLLRRAGGGEMAAGAGEVTEQLPQCRPAPPHQVQDNLGPAARRLYRAGLREVRRRQRAVQWQVRKITPAEPPG